MGTIRLDVTKSGIAISEELKRKAVEANEMLEKGNGKGADFLGWVRLPSTVDKEEIASIKKCARELSSRAEVVVCIGIGGSYLGARAVYDAMNGSFELMHRKHDRTLLVFAGQNISENYMAEMMEALKEYSLATIVISKSGTTTEPAIAFRIVKEEIERRYGKEEARHRIVAITDAKRGALKTLATNEGYTTFVIPDNVGGRFSVLSPVGLLPLAVAGIDIDRLIAGAESIEKATCAGVRFEDNVSAIYAATRYALYKQGKKIEILGSYEPRLQNINEWWKQLYGESEGKEHKGLYPASVTLTADLHSMGQYIQDGERHLFETIISVVNPQYEVKVPSDKDNLDGLNYLAGRRMSQINRMAELGVCLAHVDGGVPNLRVEIGSIDETTLGELIYFFEKACGISGYLLGVNPFDQPGVEAYKKNMFALLEKPGYEAESAAIKSRL